MPNLTKPQDNQLATRMLSLVKKADMTLSKYDLTGHRAAVAIVLDWSGSMTHLYATNQIQRLVERFVALGHRFDDDGAIDLYAYDNRAMYIGQLTAVDCSDVAGRIRAVMGGMGGTDYAAGIKAYRKQTFGMGMPVTTMHTALKTPHYVGFITDGQNGGSNMECMDQFRAASFEPVFIQCIALGDNYDPKADEKTVTTGGFFGMGKRTYQVDNEPPAEFEFLARLDTNVKGRFVDNAGFFATETPDSLSDEAFMDRLMGEYPEWLKLAKHLGLIA